MRFALPRTTWQAIEAYFNRAPGVKVTPAELAAVVDIAEDEAYAVLLAIGSIGHVRLWWTIWHLCTLDKPVQRRLFSEGFQPAPWECPNCWRVAAADELMYEFEAEMLEKVEFV